MRTVLLTLLLLAGSLGQAAAQGLGVTGTVRDEAGMPLAGVTVRLITPTRGVKIGGTNEKGQFAFRDLGNGNYQLWFEKEGYVTRTLPVEVTYDQDDDDDDGEHQVTLVREKPGVAPERTEKPGAIPERPGTAGKKKP